MKKGFGILLLGVLFLLTNCNKDKIDRFDVVYDVRFESDWSSATHPTDYPSNAHFSPMIGVSHTVNTSIFTVGLSATDGVKNLAETGNTDEIENDITKLINGGTALDQFKGESFDSPGNNTAQIGVRAGHHFVTVMSMIAPSPDWYVAATTSLIDPTDGEFYDMVTVHAMTFDAGTDAGNTFVSADTPVEPRDVVTILNEGPLTEGTDTIVNMGRFIFTRVK